MNNTTEKKRILIVDDEDDLRDMIEFQFKAKGYDVASARDGKEGLEMLEKVKPHLVILDLNMPRMGGIELYQRMCGENGRPTYPVLILTARANTRKLFMEFDVDGFVTKPFEIDDLIKEAEIIIRNYGKKQQEGAAGREVKNIFVVDNNSEELSKISVAFLGHGYKVSTANSGLKAIEKMGTDHVDVALVNLDLMDIPGDILILRLTRMSKTMDIKFILYLRSNGKHKQAILDKMSVKSGVLQCIEYSSADELLEFVDHLSMKK